MTDRTEGALAQVTALDEERRRYEAWLAQLDARRGSAPEHVLERVRLDYEGRLRDVLARLAEHAELLRGVVAGRSQELATLRDAERQRQDERAEAELRAVVGEYTPEQWEELAAQADAVLEELGARRSAAEAELAHLEEVHALAATGGAPIVEPPAAAAPEPPPAERAAPAWADAPPAEAAPAEIQPNRTGGVSASHGPPPPPPPRAPDAFGGWDDEPAPLADVGRAAPTAPAPLADRRADRDWLTSDEADAGAHVPAGSATAARAGAASETGGAPAKTLRCAECGTMNYPTEWYCERCGGELAAL